MITRRKLIRLAGAIVAGCVSLWLCLPQFARAESGCGLSDAIRYQAALTDPPQEASPAYILAVAEDFIARCPDRFEVREALLVAARGALDHGDAARAARHYTAAIKAGARLSPATHLDHAVALMVAGDARAARIAREAAVRNWLTRLAASGTADISMDEVAAGTIFFARYITPDPDVRISAVWLAVPAGDGLPSAVVLRDDAMRASLRALVSGERIEAMTVLDHRGCRTSNVLHETTPLAPAQSFDAAARAALIASMKRPAPLEKTSMGEPLPSCIGLDLMFYVPAAE